MKIFILSVLLFAITSNNFSQWTKIKIDTYENLYFVYFLSENTGFTGGGGGVLYKTTDAGVTWHKINSATTQRLFSISFIDNAYGLIGADNGFLLKTTNGGETWEPIFTKSKYLYESVTVIDKNNYWAFGGISAPGRFGQIIKTTDGGKSWTVKHYVSGYIIISGGFIDEKNGIAVGSNGYILSTTDGGENWAEFMLTGAWLRSVRYFNDNTAWVVGHYGYVFRTDNNGLNWWLYAAPPFNEEMFEDVDFIDDFGVIVGESGTIFVSTDAGSTWNYNTGVTSEYLEDVHCFNKHTIWLSGSKGVLFKYRGGFVGINEHNPSDKSWRLSQNYPNPFNPSTGIKYQLSEPGFVRLIVYDFLGNEIATLVNESKETGEYEVKYEAANLPSGVYLYKIEIGNWFDTKKMLILK